MKRLVALTAAMLILAGLPFAQGMSNNKKVATVTGGVRWSQCAFGPDAVLHLCFEEDTDRGHLIHYVSYDGTTASTPFNVTGDLDQRGERPGIAAGTRGDIAVAWGVDIGDYVYIRIYDHRNKAWGPVETVAAGYGWDEPQPAIEADGTVHCFFSNESQGRAYVSTRVNGVWGSPVRLSAGYGKQGGVAVGPNNTAWAVWREKQSNGDYKSYYSFRPHGGSWANAELATTSGNSSSHPSLTVGPDNVGVAVWGNIDELENGADIRLVRLGTGEPREVPIVKYMQHYPRVAVDPNLKIHVATQIGGGDFGSGAFYVNNVSGSWSEPQTLASSMDKVVGIAADPYGNVAVCASDMLSDGRGSDIYIWSLQPISPRYIYAPVNLASTISLKKVRTTPGITYNLTWSTNSANNEAWVAGYNIYVKEGNGEYTLLLSVNKSTLSSTFTYSDLTKKRRFAIATTNPGGGESDLVEF